MVSPNVQIQDNKIVSVLCEKSLQATLDALFGVLKDENLDTTTVFGQKESVKNIQGVLEDAHRKVRIYWMTHK